MQISVKHESGEDFGTLQIYITQGDSASIEVDGDYGTRISIPMYNTEAQEIIKKLTALALTP